MFSGIKISWASEPCYQQLQGNFFLGKDENIPNVITKPHKYHSLNLLETHKVCKKVTACETSELDKYTVVYLTLRVI